MLIEEITTDMVTTWLTTLATRRTLHNKTLNEYREVLFRLITWAMGRVRMPGTVNPVAAVKRFGVVDDKPIRFLTLAQIDEQLDALAGNHYLRTMIATLIYTGLRLGELYWLTRSDVDLERRYVRVRRKAVLGRRWMPKTGKDRAVPISSALHSWLEAYVPPTDGPWFFVTPHG